MANERTEKSRYTSLYSPEKYVSAAQYITEMICERRAKSLKKDLPVKFWNLPEWRKYYTYQIMVCNALLKNHDDRAIINALKDEKGSYIHSLKAPWLPELIEKHEKILALKKEKATLTKTPSKSILPSTRPRFTKKNTLDLLREIDGDESERET